MDKKEFRAAWQGIKTLSRIERKDIKRIKLDGFNSEIYFANKLNKYNQDFSQKLH